MLADILPTAYEVGVLNGQVRPGDVVAIVGAGPIAPVGDQRREAVQPEPDHRDRPRILATGGGQAVRRRRHDRQRRPGPDRRRPGADRRPRRRRRDRGRRHPGDVRARRGSHAAGRADREHRRPRQARHAAPGAAVDPGRDHHDRAGRHLLHADAAATAGQSPARRQALRHPPLRLRPVRRGLPRSPTPARPARSRSS